MKTKLQYFVVHSYLFAIYPIIFIFSYNINELRGNPEIICLPFVLSVMFTLILQSLLIYGLKCKYKAGIMTTLILICFYFYGYIYDFIHENVFLIRQRILLPLWLLITTIALITVVKIKNEQRLYALTKFLNVVGIILCTIVIVNVAIYCLNEPMLQSHTYHKEMEKTGMTGGYETNDKPDIYYIILDSYTSEYALKNIFNYENNGFINYLQQKGFYVVPNGRSNYTSTIVSLPSSLNMEHLAEVAGINKNILRKMVAQNKVTQILEDNGYEAINIGSVSMVTFEKSRNYLFNEFNIVLLNSTLLRPLNQQILSPFSRKNVLAAFDKLAEIPRSSRNPKFVFAHILCPHPPYVFGSQGEPVSTLDYVANININASISNDRSQLYLDQVTFINSKVTDLIEQLLSEYKKPPIIIIQGDHGAGFAFNHNGFLEPDDRFLKAQVGILNAYLVPEKTRNLLYDDITPVNSFRIIFNSLFNTNYELLPDESWLFQDFSRPYRFTNVTKIAKP